MEYRPSVPFASWNFPTSNSPVDARSGAAPMIAVTSKLGGKRLTVILLDAAINVSLVEIAAIPKPLAAQRDGMRFTCRYGALVTLCGPDPGGRLWA